MKVRIRSKSNMFTSACGVDIPIEGDFGTFDSIPEAADYIAKYCGYDAKTVEMNGFWLEEIADGS